MRFKLPSYKTGFFCRVHSIPGLYRCFKFYVTINRPSECRMNEKTCGFWILDTICGFVWVYIFHHSISFSHIKRNE